MDQIPVVQEMIDKTFREMNEPKKPLERSRMATSTNGYIHLIGWSNAQLLRIVVRVFTSSLPKSEYRLKAQLDDAARSVIANIEEGFRRPTTIEYITFLGYSQASLTEVKGDIQRCLQDKFFRSEPNSCLADIGIDLSTWHEAVKQSVISTPGKSHLPAVVRFCGTKEGKFLYPSVDNLTAGQLTHEMVIELINKTDWHLRRLVVSLEEKLNRDRQFYQVEKARVRGNTSWRR